MNANDELLELSGLINIDKTIDFLLEFRLQETRKMGLLNLEKMLKKTNARNLVKSA